MTLKTAWKTRTTTLSALAVATGSAAVVVGLTLGGGGSATAAISTPAQATAPVAAPAAAPAAEAPKAPAKPVTQRSDAPISPQMQLDDTDAEHMARIGQWQDCLVDNGAEYATDPRSLGIAPRPVADPVPESARAACTDVLPRLPKETNPNLNPDYVADSEANVACLRDHGVMVHLYHDTSVWPDGLSWTYDSSDGSDLPDNQSQIEKSCELAAFAD